MQELEVTSIMIIIARRGNDAGNWRIMQRYGYIKMYKSSSKLIIAAMQMFTVSVLTIISNNSDFNKK